MNVLACVFIVAACLGACSGSSTGPINPGDRVGDFVITAEQGEGIKFMLDTHCPAEGTTETCELPVGKKVNVSQGFISSPGGESLDKIWAAQTNEMTINGRPVNLQAFGYTEFYNPAVGTIRAWNVVVSSEKPGTLTAISQGVTEGEAWTYAAVVIFDE